MIYEIIGGAICIIVGFLGGCAIKKEAYHNSKVGKLRIDDSTGESYLFLELSVPIEYVLQQKEVILDVDLTPLRDNNMG